MVKGMMAMEILRVKFFSHSLIKIKCKNIVCFCGHCLKQSHVLQLVINSYENAKRGSENWLIRRLT